MKPNAIQWVVKVGTNGETAVPEYAEFAGTDTYGPFRYEEDAETFAEAVKAEFAKYPTAVFVYGQPVVEVLPLREKPEAPLGAVVNWIKEAVGNDLAKGKN